MGVYVGRFWECLIGVMGDFCVDYCVNGWCWDYFLVDGKCGWLFFFKIELEVLVDVYLLV